MSTTAHVEKRIQLSADRAANLSHLAQEHQIHEDDIVEKALDIFFTLTDLFSEQEGWYYLSERSLQNIWDNEEDAIYDNWRSLYDVQEDDELRVRISDCGLGNADWGMRKRENYSLDDSALWF